MNRIKQEIFKEVNDNIKEEVAKDLFSQFKGQCKKIKKDIDTIEEGKDEITEKLESFEKSVRKFNEDVSRMESDFNNLKQKLEN